MSQKDTEKKQTKKEKRHRPDCSLCDTADSFICCTNHFDLADQPCRKRRDCRFWWKNRQYAGSITKYAFCDAGAALTSSSGSEANAEEVQTQAQTEAAQAESAAGQTQAAGQATMMEPQTYENDANGNMIVPERQAGSMETEPAWEYVLEKTGDSVLDDANYLAAMYDYDGAIAKIQSVSGYESNAAYTAAIADYEQRKSEAVVYADNSTIPHISSIRLLLIQAEPLMIASQSASRMV